MARFSPEMKGAIPAVSTEKPVRIAASKVEGVEAVMASVTGGVWRVSDWGFERRSEVP